MYKVSVIVPNYNHAPYLRQRIDSILNQTFQDFELILLDDCSTDNSREIFEGYRDNPHVTQIVSNESNGGTPFKQWNKGVELAQGEWIWIAESDDWAEPTFLEVMMKKLSDLPSVGLAYAKAVYMKDDKEMWKQEFSGESRFYKGSDFIKEKLLYANVIYNVSMTLFRKDTFGQINHSLYADMRLCGDWWFYTLIAEKCDVLEVDQPLTFYRVHTSNTSSSAEPQGLSFTEGLDVLDYIVNNHSVSARQYCRFWGRQWVKYKNKYHFPKEVNKQIKTRVIKNYPLICFYYFIYSIKKRCQK